MKREKAKSLDLFSLFHSFLSFWATFYKVRRLGRLLYIRIRGRCTDKSTYLDDILVGEGLVRFVVLGVLEKNLVHVGARVLVKLVARTEDNQRNFTVAKYRQLVCFFHNPEFSFVKRHLQQATRGQI